MSKRAFITGISGQDGSYLSELLLGRGYEVHGLVRNAAPEAQARGLERIIHLRDRLVLHAVSLDRPAGVLELFERVCPDECYHLAAYSIVHTPFEVARASLAADLSATCTLLAALAERAPACRLYFAGTSEMFGAPDEAPQRETSRFRPRSAYGIAKLAGYHLVRNYRERFGLFACTGLAYNHESPRRGQEFVTRRIAAGVARILAGRQDRLALGNLEARRDWGHAREFVHGMWLMLQQPEPDDYVLATGETHSVREFAEVAFALVGLDWRAHVFVDPSLCRPAEDLPLVGDAHKARERLGWCAQVGFTELVREMVICECEAVGVSVPAGVERPPLAQAAG